MKLIFTYSSSPNVGELDKAEILQLSLQIPDEVQYLIGVQERIRAIGKYVGQLTQAYLHISCSGLGIKNELMNTPETVDDNFFRLFQPNATILYFSYGNRGQQKRVLKIIAPKSLGLPQHLFIPRGKRASQRKSLPRQIHLLDSRWFTTPEQTAYFEILQNLSAQMLMLLNAEPNNQGANWALRGFHPGWWDNDLLKQTNKQGKSLAKKQDAAEKASIASKKSTSKEHGKGRTIGAVPGMFQGIQFRSQLEIRFATECEIRKLAWIYESERLGAGNYLVDFHLPKQKAWVEVKGRFEARDHYLLKEVAQVLQARGEQLYVFTSGRPMRVTADEFEKLSHDEFWAAIAQSDET
jgi:hypothetical protein